MVSSTGILLKRDCTSYETSSYSFELSAFFTKSGKVKVSLILYSFLTNDFRSLAITFDALYICRYLFDRLSDVTWVDQHLFPSVTWICVS